MKKRYMMSWYCDLVWSDLLLNVVLRFRVMYIFYQFIQLVGIVKEDVWWCGERWQINFFMFVFIVVEVVERGEIGLVVVQQGGWGVGVGYWVRVSWGIRV